MKNETGAGVFDWNVTGASICYLAVEVFLSASVLHKFVCSYVLLQLVSSLQVTFLARKLDCSTRLWNLDLNL